MPAFAEYIKRKLNWALFRIENLTMSDRRRRLFLRAFDKNRFAQNPISYKFSGDPTDHSICPIIHLPASWDEYLSILSTNYVAEFLEDEMAPEQRCAESR
jgi:hypothetical protein